MARRLKELKDVRRYLANLINRVEAGQVAPEKASKLTYVASALVRVIEAMALHGLDERLAALEERHKCPGNES